MLHFPWCQLWLEVIIPSSFSPSLLCFAIFATMLMCFWDCTAGQVSAVALTHIALGDLVFSSLPKTDVSAQLKTEVCGMRLKLAMAGGEGGWLNSPPRAMVWGSHQRASREATAPSHSSHILLSHPKTPDKPGALSCLSLPPANQR